MQKLGSFLDFSYSKIFCTGVVSQPISYFNFSSSFSIEIHNTDLVIAVKRYSFLSNKSNVTFTNFWQNPYLVYVVNFHVVLFNNHDVYLIHVFY